MSHVSHVVSQEKDITTPFPVTHSILSTSALLAEILPLYALGSQLSCTFLIRGVNDTYLIQTPTEKYILRAYQTGWRTLSEILFELDVLSHLAQKGIPVSIPVAQRDGSYICTIQAPEGVRQLVLFTYAPGVSLDRRNSSDSYYHGRAIAAMHNATDDFSSSHARTPLDLSSLIDQSLQAIQSLHTFSATDWGYLLDVSERLRSRVQQLARQGLDWGLCHGDSHMLNEHIDTHHVITLFDFDCCAIGWRAYDLATVRWSEGFYKMDPGDVLWNAFLKGYTEVRPLSATDRASIPAFVALREIWHTALIAWLQPSSGVQEWERILHRTIRLLQEWEKAELHA